MKKFLTISLCLVLVVASLLTLVSCKQKPQEEADLPALADTAFSGYEFPQVQAQNLPVTYTPLNMATEYMRQNGVYGDGCQWPVSFESSADGSVMFYGIDVAGMYRSVDHGATWEKCNTGVVSRGVGMFGIDPKNPQHVLATGLSGSSAKNTGMYVSHNGGETWAPTGFNVKIGGERYLWDGLEFDPTSFDQAENLCKVCYYSIPYLRDTTTRKNAYQAASLESPIKNGEQGLYKSVDGGNSFVQISSDSHLSDGIVKVTANGNLVIGNQYGLFLVDGNGQILNRWLENEIANYQTDKITIQLDRGGTADILKCYLGVTGLDCVGNVIYAQTWDGIFTLDLSATTPNAQSSAQSQKIVSENYKTQNWGQFLAVSKSNPLHMVYQYRSRVDKVSWDTYWVNYVDVSFDGGKTWTKAEADAKTMFSATSWASREKLFIIDPSDDNVVLCYGSDFIMRSTDGGRNFVQANGISNMMCGAKMHFNYHDDQLILFGAQDYTGAVSIDGGKTFKRLSITADGTSYGHCYDAFAADVQTYFGFARTSWYGENNLVVTHDGGNSWVHTGIVIPYGTPTITLQSHKNPDVLFAGCYRSADRGHTWQKMSGCICASTISYGANHEIIGYDVNRNIVVSFDDGASWKKVFDREQLKFSDSPRTVSESIRDLSYDQVNNVVYAAVDTHYKNSNGEEYNSHAFYKVTFDDSWQYVSRASLKIFSDTDGYANYSDVEVDPNATNVVYVALAGNYFSKKYALQRSVDGGETWQVLTSNTETEPAKRGLCTNRGGYEASMLAVQPNTGKVLVGCGCYGFEWITPPYDTSELNHAAPATHAINFVYDGKVVHVEQVKNNRYFNYLYDVDGLTFEGWYKDAQLKTKWEGGCAYNSTYLYAKMKPAEQITFWVDGKEFAKVDLEDYNPNFEIPQPTVDGYTFVGWYVSDKLTTQADFSQIHKSTDVFAAFYKTQEEVFDPAVLDYSAYLQYSNRRLSAIDRVTLDEQCDNRCAFIALEAGCDYLLTFKMDVRCRYGLNKTDFAKNKEPNVYFIDERDVNGTSPVDQWVYLKFNSGENTQMLLFYYTATSESGLDFSEIRQTISCRKVVGEMCYLLK